MYLTQNIILILKEKYDFVQNNRNLTLCFRRFSIKATCHDLIRRR